MLLCWHSYEPSLSWHFAVFFFFPLSFIFRGLKSQKLNLTISAELMKQKGSRQAAVPWARQVFMLCKVQQVAGAPPYLLSPLLCMFSQIHVFHQPLKLRWCYTVSRYYHMSLTKWIYSELILLLPFCTIATTMAVVTEVSSSTATCN